MREVLYMNQKHNEILFNIFCCFVYPKIYFGVFAAPGVLYFKILEKFQTRLMLMCAIAEAMSVFHYHTHLATTTSLCALKCYSTRVLLHKPVILSAFWAELFFYCFFMGFE